MPTEKFIKNILLIDDDPDELMLFNIAIQEIDPSIQVSYISNKDQLPKEDNCKIPDLLFLDINMPDWDGFTWLQKIRNKGVQVPIVMFSTSSNPEKINKAYTNGADLYLSKPMTFGSFVNSLQEVLQLNWSKPEEVTNQHYINGRFRAFASKN